MLDSSADIKESIRFLFGLRKNYSKWTKSLFLLASEIYKKPSNQEATKKYKKWALFLAQAFSMLQLGAVIWTSDTQIKNWQNFYTLWRAIEYTRLDPICEELFLSQKCVIFSYAIIVSSLFIGIFLLLLRVYLKKSISKIQILLAKLLFVCKVIFIPLLVIVSLSLKYSWDNTKIPQNSEIASMDLGKIGICLSVISIAILLILTYSRIVFDYDCRHSHSNSNFYCKSTTKPDKISFFFNTITVIFFVFIGESNYYPYRIFIFFIHLIPAAMYFSFLPYYNFPVNFAKSAKHVFASSSSLIMIIGKAYESSFFCILGFLLINPLLLIVWYFALQYAKQKSRKLKNHKISSAFDFELIQRDSFIYSESSSMLMNLDKFSKIFNSLDNFSQHLVTFWESSYCFYQCEKHTLALLVLNKNKYPANLELDYQEFLLLSDFYTVNNQISEEYKLITRTIKYEKAKTLDKTVCLQALGFWEALVSDKTSLKTLEDLGNELKKSLTTLQNYYQNCYTKFQDSVIFLDLYSTFVYSFYGDIDRSVQLNTRKENILKYTKQKDQKSLLYYSEENPLLIISACDENIGKLMYVNTACENMFQISEVIVFNIYIQDLFPQSLNVFSSSMLKEFRSQIFDTTVYIDSILPTIDSKGFLVEAMVSISLLALRQPFYMCIFKPLLINREVIIISKIGVVEGCSEGAGKILGIEGDLKNKHIEMLIMISFANIKKFREKEFKIPFNEAMLTYKKIKIKNVVLRLLHLYKNETSFKEISSEHYISKADFKVSFAVSSEHAITKNVMSDPGSLLNYEETALIKKKIETKDNTQSSSSSSLPLHKIKGFSNQGQKAIKVLAYIVFISVRNIQVFVVVLSNIGVMVYFWNRINIDTSQVSMSNLGNTLYALSNIGDIANLVQSAASSMPDLIPGYMVSFNTSYNELMNEINNFIEFNEKWDYCSVCENLFSKNIPVYDYENQTVKLDLMNAHDFLSKFIEKVECI